MHLSILVKTSEENWRDINERNHVRVYSKQTDHSGDQAMSLTETDINRREHQHVEFLPKLMFSVYRGPGHVHDIVPTCFKGVQLPPLPDEP